MSLIINMSWFWRVHRSARLMALLPVTLAAATLIFLSAPSRADAQVFVGISVNVMPPALPAFYQPAATVPNQIWEPGYWGYGSDGYFWVPGTWVLAPRAGLLWTPGYWAWNAGSYGWYRGYWGRSVGYYGGINYGYGYYGTGYMGGRWYGSDFRYNVAVSNINGNGVFAGNTYVDRTVYVDQTQGSRVSYNGGPNGITAHPSQAEIAVENQRQYPMTSEQSEHVQASQQNRSYLASVNHGTPKEVSVPRPLVVHDHPQARPDGSPRPM
jgi:hypothetical protein